MTFIVISNGKKGTTRNVIKFRLGVHFHRQSCTRLSRFTCYKVFLNEMLIFQRCKKGAGLTDIVVEESGARESPFGKWKFSPSNCLRAIKALVFHSENNRPGVSPLRKCIAAAFGEMVILIFAMSPATLL